MKNYSKEMVGMILYCQNFYENGHKCQRMFNNSVACMLIYTPLKMHTNSETEYIEARMRWRQICTGVL